MDNFIELPKINFEPLLDYSEETFLKQIWSHPAASCFLVYLRCRYSFQEKWEYLIECCGLYNAGDVMWFNDWYEGQEDVEYLGIAVVDDHFMED